MLPRWRINNFRNKVLGLSEEEQNKQNKIDIRSYAMYLLKEGKIEEKQELMQSFKSRLALIHKQVVVDE